MMGSKTGVGLLCLIGLLLAGCSDDDTGPAAPTGSLRVIQAAESTATIDVLVDGNVVIHRLPAGATSSAVAVPAGQREIAFRPVGGESSPHVLDLAVGPDHDYTTVVVDSAAVLDPIVLSDTGSTPAVGRTKLQVANFASLAGPLDVYRRQPDFDGLVTLVFPFAYRSLSGYVESDPGDWQVLIASEQRVSGVPPETPEDTLLVVDPVALTAGQASTVVIVDKPGGGIDAVIVRDR
jgi:hypothetical protein